MVLEVQGIGGNEESSYENGNLQTLDELIALKSTIKDSKWRKEDARMMAIDRYRESYLTEDLQVKEIATVDYDRLFHEPHRYADCDDLPF